MDIKHYQVKPPKRKAPAKGWKQAWYGYYRLEEVTRHEIESTKLERQLEVDCFLSIIEDINKRGKKHINLIELGSGWGEWCMALAGVVDFKLIPHNIKDYSCLAVEAEPLYCKLIMKHIEINELQFRINAMEYAVTDKNSSCRFNKYTTTNAIYGQGITFGNFGGSKLKTWILAVYHLLINKTVRVFTTKVDTIISYYFSHIDIIQCDVQGVEDRVIKGAMNSIKQGKIDYWLIGTHSKGLNRKCKELLSPYYDCIVDVEPSKDKVMGLLQDGTQLYRRKGL